MTEQKLCECGCGQPTGPVRVNDKSKGWVKGEQLRFIKGHAFNIARKMEDAPRWSGGKHADKGGYIVVQTPTGRQREHNMIAEKVLGRALKFFGTGHPDNEVVHHVYGDKQDNDGPPFRLLICTHSYHTALHHRLEQSDKWPEFPKIKRNDKRTVQG